MSTFRELDGHTTCLQQLEHDAAPVVLVNVFHVAPEDADRLIGVWEDDAALACPHLFTKVAVPGICLADAVPEAG